MTVKNKSPFSSQNQPNTWPIELLNNTQQVDWANPLFQCRVPVNGHVVKKNGRPIFRGRTGRPFIGKTDKLKSAENILINEFYKVAREKRHQILSQPLWAIFHFYYPMNQFYTQKAEISKKMPDLSNLYELPQDCMQRAGIIRNDSQIKSHDFSRQLPGDRFELEVILQPYQLCFKQQNGELVDVVGPIR
jgi:Holliday junction resolvase RusA-like endonuclease